MKGLFLRPALYPYLVLLVAFLAAMEKPEKAGAQSIYPPGDPRRTYSSMLNVREFGAVGDGVANDTAAIQRAVNTAMSGLQRFVYFPPGVYLVNSVMVGPGITLLTFGATMKVCPNAGEFNVVFTTHKHVGYERYYWSSDRDSAPLVINGFKYDGNAAAQGPYEDWQLQHQAFVALAADPSRSGRLNALIQNCQGWDGVGDFIYAYTNSNVVIRNCSARDVFRGLISVGANANIEGRDLIATGDRFPTGIDIEPSQAGPLGVVNLKLTNVDLKGDFDVAVQPGSNVFIDNLKSGPPFNLVNRGSTIEIVNSRFEMGAVGESNRIRVRGVDGATTFKNCDFIATPEPATTQGAATSQTQSSDPIYAARVDWRGGKSNDVTFDGCRFDAVGGLATAAILSDPDQQELGNRLIVNDSVISDRFYYGVDMVQGGNLEVLNTQLNSRTGVYLDYKEKYTYSARFKGVRLGDRVQNYLRMDSGLAQNVVSHQAQELTAAQNHIWNPGGNVGANTFRGQRIIRGDANPTTTKTPGFLGDLYIRESATLEERWQCVSTDTSQAVWILIYSRSVN